MKALVLVYLLSLTLFPFATLAHPKGMWWGTDECYSSPAKADNDCSDHQQTGFDWSDLAVGSFSNYAGFDFSGFSSRNGLDPSAAGSDKCIVGKLGKDSSSSPKMSYGQDHKSFSVSSFSLATSKQADVRIVYNMPDGSACTAVASCSPDRTDIHNDQCGGATSVSFQLADDSVEDCDLGIYKINFDCSPALDASVSSTFSVPSSTASELESTTAVMTWVTVTTCPVTDVVTSSGTPITFVTSTLSTVTLTSAPTYPAGSTSAGPTGSGPGSAPGSAPTSAPLPAPTSAASSAPVTIPVSVPTSAPVTAPISVPNGATTVVTWVTSTTRPVTEVVTSSSTPITAVTSTVETMTLTSTYPTGPTSVAPIGSSQVSVPVSAPVSAPEGATTVVTWVTLTTCPVTQVVTSSGTAITSVTQSVSTVTMTSVSTYCPSHKCTAVPTAAAPIETAPASTTTVVTWETPITYPVTTVITSGGGIPITSVTNSVSTATLTTAAAIANPVGPTGIAPIETGATGVPSPAPATPCPNSVPKCINTWLNLLPKCDSNSAASCYCPSNEFTSKVIACIQAWGATPEEIQSALSYFTGICAAFVPKNPGIITAVPPTITLGPAPTTIFPLTNTAAHPTAPVPTTAPMAPAPVPCTTITYSSWTVTVPQVVFTTPPTGSAQTTVGLIPGGPTSASAGPTYLPNPWVSSSSSTLAKTPGRSTAPTPAATPSPKFPLSNSGSMASVSSGWVWSVAIAVLLGFFY
ncbi:hypothetical protein BO71DRAFT_445721 [Aspergillus ellipticus CBS 707.79]|uniref:Extracellular membrane protein CFEM domain-containing protein n=1 Tax=Aspergillus ellipticus CBS 707.79 TaxID=1448320 RepID=A0A319CTC1_9EURO|nr:hypothetical protein BO71DRAFT_445721 [Aspergillus ellipticus CBS 707.79]